MLSAEAWHNMHNSTRGVYADEDLVGHAIEIARSCHPRTMAVTAMLRRPDIDWICQWLKKCCFLKILSFQYMFVETPSLINICSGVN